VDVLLDVLEKDPQGINECWKFEFVDALRTITQLNINILELERKNHRVMKDLDEAKDLMVNILGRLRRAIDGLSKSGRRQAEVHPRILHGECSCRQGGECRGGVHTAVVPGQAEGVHDEDPGHFREDREQVECYDFNHRLDHP